MRHWRTQNKIILDFNSLSNININSSTSTTTYFRYKINKYNSQWPGDNIFTWYDNNTIKKILKQSTTTTNQTTQQSDNLYSGGVHSINPLDTVILKWINLMLVRDGLNEYIYSDTDSYIDDVPDVGNMKLLYTITNDSLNLNKIYLGAPAAGGGAADVTVSNLMVFNSALPAKDVQTWVTYVNNGYTEGATEGATEWVMEGATVGGTDGATATDATTATTTTTTLPPTITVNSNTSWSMYYSPFSYSVSGSSQSNPQYDSIRYEYRLSIYSIWCNEF